MVAYSVVMTQVHWNWFNCGRVTWLMVTIRNGLIGAYKLPANGNNRHHHHHKPNSIMIDKNGLYRRMEIYRAMIVGHQNR